MNKFLLLYTNQLIKINTQYINKNKEFPDILQTHSLLLSIPLYYLLIIGIPLTILSLICIYMTITNISYRNLYIIVVFLIIITPSLSTTQCQSNLLTATINKSNNTSYCTVSYYDQDCVNGVSETVQYTLSSCAIYTCKLAQGNNCYSYSSSSLTIDQCLQQCCHLPASAISQSSYSSQLNQCIETSSQSQIDSDSLTLPSNKIIIIVSSIISVLLIFVIGSLIIFRQKISQCIKGYSSGEDNAQQQQIKTIPRKESIYQAGTSECLPQSDAPSIIIQVLKQQTCTICLLENSDSMTVCKHYFHVSCLATWLGKSFRCPNCVNEDLNPVTVFCKKCKNPFVEIKMNRNPPVDQIQKKLKQAECSYCKGQQ